MNEPGCGLDDRMLVTVTVPPVGYFAKTVASNLVGAGVAPQTDTHRVGKSVTVITVPTSPPKTGITDMETLLQCLLPGVPVADSRERPGPVCRDGLRWCVSPAVSRGHVPN